MQSKSTFRCLPVVRLREATLALVSSSPGREIFKGRFAAVAFTLLGCLAFSAGLANGSDDPSPVDALKLKPTQKGVEFDLPAADQQENCKVRTVNGDGERGWVVSDAEGVILRRFIDTNSDNKLDRWCYFQNGVEIYRDIDSNFNGVADQYRWLGTAGIRWGIDADEDGTINSWRLISAEEVTAEIVAAVRDQDQQRFDRLLLTENELEQLGLGENLTDEIKKKIENAKSQFRRFANSQDAIIEATRWLHFGGTRPNLIPSGTDGSTKDVIVYDNVAAIVETAGKHEQIAIGTLVSVDRAWRAIELPEVTVDGRAAANGGMIFNASVATVDDSTDSQLSAAETEASQQLLEQYDQIDRQLAEERNPAAIARLNDQRANVLIQLANNASTADELMNWVRQIADTVSGAFQTGEYPGGMAKLVAFERQLKTRKAPTEAIAYVNYRVMNAKYTQDIQAENADLAKIQEEWLENLATFVRTHRQSEHAPDAMLQLALAEEFGGQDERAVNWYQQTVRDFPDSPFAAKAQGAIRRLNSVGRAFRLQGRTIDGRQFDSQTQQGRVVIVHYWASWCELCKQEFQTLKDLQAKYGRDGLTIVGVNLDLRQETAQQELRDNPLSWPQLYEEGGLDGGLALDMGIVTLPTMLLLDKRGRVVSRNITAGELDRELARLLR